MIIKAITNVLPFLFQLVDLCLLDVECLQYSYSVIAASAIYHMASEHIALSVSGKSKHTIITRKVILEDVLVL